MGGGKGAEDMEEMWNFDELDELEAENGSSDGEAELQKPREAGEQSKEVSDEDEPPTDTGNLKSSVVVGGDIRGKLDFLFGEGGSESEEEDDDWDEDDDDAGSLDQEARPSKKEKPVFEDPRKKLTNIENPRLRGERVPLQERVRQRFTHLAEARIRGEPPGPPPPPEEGAEGQKKRPSVVSAALAEQPLPQRPAVREQRRARSGRIHENIELREKGSSNGAPVNHECRGVRSEGLPGMPAPVLLRHACRGSGFSRGGFARPSILAMAVAEAQEATARATARQALEPKRCAKCGSELERPMHCSQCLEVCYCSRECQRQDWKVHKRCCGRKGESVPATGAAAAGALGGRSAGSGARAVAAEPEDDAPDLHEQEAEAESLRQQEERQRLEEQRLARLEVERQRKEEARQEQARKDRARNAELRQERLEEARRKAEKERQKREAERAKEEIEARRLQEEAMRRAQEAEESARKKVEMKAYEDFLLAQLKRQELLDSHGGAPPPQASPLPAPAALEPATAAPPRPKEPQPVKTPVIAPNSAYNLYKRHQPSMGQRLAALGMDELRGF